MVLKFDDDARCAGSTTARTEVAALQQLIDKCEAFEFGPYRLIPSKRILLAGQDHVELGSCAFDILALLLRHRGEVVSRRQILEQVWPGLTIDEANLRVQMSDLRRALGIAGEGSAYIKNVQGRGYVFVAPVKLLAPCKQTIPNATYSLTGRLPSRSQCVIGRNDTVQTVVSQILACRFRNHRWPWGIGKTTVAVELGHRVASEFNNEVYYVDLGSLKAADMVLPTIATALGCTVQSGDLLAGLTASTADRRLLVIFDCCEHVIEIAAEVTAALFRDAPQVHLIATSREALRAEGETVFIIDPLGLPTEKKELTAEKAFAAASVQLFMQRAASSGYARS